MRVVIEDHKHDGVHGGHGNLAALGGNGQQDPRRKEEKEDRGVKRGNYAMHGIVYRGIYLRCFTGLFFFVKASLCCGEWTNMLYTFTYVK